MRERNAMVLQVRNASSAVNLCVSGINIQLAEHTLTQECGYVCVPCIPMPYINLFVSSIAQRWAQCVRVWEAKWESDKN